MLCPKCSTENLDSAKFCAECGARLAAICSACGTQNPPDAKFCIQCGIRLDSAPSQPIAPPPPAKPESRPTPTLIERPAIDTGALPEGERKTVRQPLPGSWESLFHSIRIANFHLELASAAAAHLLLSGRLLERAIGVIYRPQSELHSHYFEARIADQFDDILHYDRTRAVEPLERTNLWEAGEIPETYPSGI